MRFFTSLLLLLCSLAPAGRAADLLFAFGDDRPTAHVYEASSLTLVAAPQVIEGARVVFGRPAPGGFDRYYVVGRGGVSILDGSFAEAGRIGLPDGALGALQPAAFAPDSDSLLVVIGSKAYRIDTVREKLDTVVDTGVELAGVAIPAKSTHAYLIGADRRTVFRMAVDSGLLDNPTMTLAQAAERLDGSLVTDPAKRARLDLAALTDQFFQPGERPSRILGPTPPVTQSRTEVVSDDGRFVWRLDAAGGLRKVDMTGEAADVMAGDLEFSAVSLLPEQVEGTQGPQLQKISGDGQLILAGADFSLQVNASGLTGGLPLTVNISPGLATCQPAALNGLTTINCTAVASVLAATEVAITVSGLGNPVVFTVAVVPPGLQDGVTILSGNNQNVATGANFTFAVRSIQSGLPGSTKSVNITSISPAVASCPASRTLSLLGEATFACTTSFVGAVTPVTITVSDGSNTANVMLNVQPSGGGSGGLTKISSDPSTALEGSSFNLIVAAGAGGAPEPNLTLNVAVSSNIVTCPATVVTNPGGQASIPCQANQVAQNMTTTITVSEGGRSVTFTVTVANQTVSNGLQIVSGNNQVVSQNSVFPQPLVISARVNGTPQPNLELTVQSTNPAVLCPQMILTDQDGIASIRCNTGSVAALTTAQIQVTDSLDRSLPVPFSVTVSPIDVGLADIVEVITSGPIVGTVGSTIQNGLRVRALNASQEPVPGATIYFRSPQDVTFDPAVTTTNLSGEATTDVIFGCPSTPSGTIQIGLTATSTQATIGFQAGSGPLAQLQILRGNNQTGSPGVRMADALLVRTADVCGKPVPNVPVAWGVNPAEAAALEVAGQVSNGQGQVSALVRPTTRGGPFQVLVAAQDDSTIQTTFNLTTGNIPTTLQKPADGSGDGQQVPARGLAADPLVVVVLNESGAPVAGVDVTFGVTSGSGSVESVTGRTDVMGRATAMFRAGSGLGPAVVTASALGQSVTFKLQVMGAQPVLTNDGFTNAASFRPGLSPGSAASIFAENITGDVQGVLAAPYDPATGFPTTLRGVEVLVNGVKAPILALVNVNGQEQVNIQVPFETTGNFATVTVNNNGSQGTVANVPVFNPQPGVFEVNIEGGTFAAALHADFSLVTPSNPARPGETIQVYLTGMGRLAPPVATNVEGPIPPAFTSATPEVTLDGVLQTVVGSFYAPQLISVYQINVTIGAGAAVGNRALLVTLSGVDSKIVLLPVGAPL